MTVGPVDATQAGSRQLGCGVVCVSWVCCVVQASMERVRASHGDDVWRCLHTVGVAPVSRAARCSDDGLVHTVATLGLSVQLMGSRRAEYHASGALLTAHIQRCA